VSLDTVLFILAAVLPIAMAILGGHVASEKIGYRIAFWSLGVAAAAVVVLIGVRNEHTQNALQGQLNQIQTNTEQPPKVEVNIPPAPKQKAIMVLAKTSNTDGIEIVHDPQHPDIGWFVNVSCKNVGPVTARKVGCGVYSGNISAIKGVPTNETLQMHWTNLLKEMSRAHMMRTDLAPGENSWGSVNLGMLDVDPALNSGDKVTLVAGAILYEDDAGPHKKEFCMWAQPPFSPPHPVWHYCDIGHNKEVY
jgi:hypothetical protein